MVCAVALALVSCRQRRAAGKSDGFPHSGTAAAISDRTGLVGAAALLQLPALLLKGMLFLYAGTVTAGLQTLIGGIRAARGSALFDPLADAPAEASAVPSLRLGRRRLRSAPASRPSSSSRWASPLASSSAAGSALVEEASLRMTILRRWWRRRGLSRMVKYESARGRRCCLAARRCGLRGCCCRAGPLCLRAALRCLAL